MNLRALQARLRKLEKQSGVNDPNDIFGKMSDQEVEATSAVFDILFDDPKGHEEAIHAVMEIMDCKEHIAAAYVKYLENLDMEITDFKNLSEEELVAEVVRMEMSIEDNREGIAAKRRGDLPLMG